MFHHPDLAATYLLEEHRTRTADAERRAAWFGAAVRLRRRERARVRAPEIVASRGEPGSSPVVERVPSPVCAPPSPSPV